VHHPHKSLLASGKVSAPLPSLTSPHGCIIRLGSV